MRFLEDDDLSFCLTISRGIEFDKLADVLRVVEALPLPQTFDDVAWEEHQPRRLGLLNVFEQDDLFITLENHGFLGATYRSIKRAAQVTEGRIGHYAGICRLSGTDGYQFFEVQDGQVVVNFDPLRREEVPEAIEDFFADGKDVRQVMLEVLEHRMETTVKPEWWELPTKTFLIDYNLAY